MTALSDRALARLAARRVLSVDPARGIAVKRNVHEVVIGAPAARFAEAFHEVLIEPGARFGAIEVRRDPSRAGKPFEVGERFQGCLAVGTSFPRLRAILDRAGLGRAVTWIEESMLSDYSEITSIEDDSGSRGESPAAFRASYVYLSGCPMAGESRFEVTPIDERRCRFVAVFCYQELGLPAVLFLHRLGARLHDEVVVAQVERAAERAGAPILASTLDGVSPRRARAERALDGGLSIGA